jgi:hypothetical protein
LADPLIEYTQPQYEQRRAVSAHSASTPASANRLAASCCRGLAARQSSEGHTVAGLDPHCRKIGEADFRLFTMAGMVVPQIRKIDRQMGPVAPPL